MSSYTDKKKYDVFLSFRGEDTRATFTSYLHASLINAGIHDFRDDDSLQRGESIYTILQAIEESRIAIIIFSKKYADSRWCLQEFEKIMECRKTKGQIVLPVFYDVDPSEVRHQSGEFGKGFQSLLSRVKEDHEFLQSSMGVFPYEDIKWTELLREVASIAGFVVLNSRNEYKAIQDIVENVTRLLDKTNLFVANNPVGVESRVNDIIQLLDRDIQQSHDVLLLGMWGMGGVGKTTIAKAIYNEIGYKFEGRSFLANIREVWKENAGQAKLQEQLLSDICKEVKTKVPSIEYGIMTLKDRLCHKKVLIILDDVHTLEQLNALCGSHKWFGSGSRIVITTRDINILHGIGVNQVYKMNPMDESEAIELFSWHAFKQASPTKDFAEISTDVVKYSGGLPLALEVLGSYLFDRDVTEWKSVIDKLKIIPNEQVQKKLKISYDLLSDDTVKEIFLDIACFFIGMDRNDVTLILNGCGLFAGIGLSILVERCLVIVDHKNILRMHDLVRDMGREIIREKSPEELEERCRLWLHEDALHILSEQTGTKAIKGLVLKLPGANAKCFSSKAFKKMEKLRLLQLAGVNLDGDFKYLSKNLRWLSWNGFSSTYIPANFYRENLVSIELENSNIKLVWEEDQMMTKLKILNLSHSHFLMHTPDFSYLPNLEKLVLKDCPMLYEVSPSIGDLSKILLIDLEDCVEEDFEDMKSLVSLDVPSSSSHELSSFSNDLPRLQSLSVECSSELQLSRTAAIIADALYATNYKELEPAATTSQVSNMTNSTLTQCYSQVHVSGSKQSLLIQMGMNCDVTNILKGKIVQIMDIKGSDGYLLPGHSYPDWLNFSSAGSSVTFRVPQVEGRNLKTMMCVVYTSTPDNITSDGLKNVLVKNFTKATIQHYKREASVSFEVEEGQRVVSSIEPGNKVEVVVVFENDFVVKNTAVYLVYEEPIGEKVKVYFESQ
ncbi:hypothetical protein TSUD_285490 [Trifolium subterraneum]|uniref:TIR domain-containing protein n=1 Tax=Trifolium subterraneum TaxID=3900 RepID=A0A2Z6PH77_TRISU|nr:hypothetical protein TSUD_285490 [Trifolium subterraneum]